MSDLPEEWIPYTLKKIFEEMNESISFEIRNDYGVLTFSINGDIDSKVFQINDGETRIIKQEEFENILKSESIGLELQCGVKSSGVCHMVIDGVLKHTASVRENQTWIWNWNEEATMKGWLDKDLT